MLRWVDSFHYSSTGFVQQRYPAAAGIFAGFPGRTPSRTCVGASGGTSTLAIPIGPAVGAGSEQLVFGCWLKFVPVLLPNIAGRSGFLFARFGTLDQIGVYLEQDGSLARLVVIAFGQWNGSVHVGSREILRSSSFSVLDWVFLEIGATISNSGKVFLRLNGVEDARVEFVATDNDAPGQGWSSVLLTPSSGNAGALLVAECYLLDGVVGAGGTRFTKPLGLVEASRQLPFSPHDDGWAPSSDGKFELVVIAGEINANGRGSGTTGRWRSPNAKVPIWERRQGSAGFRALEAGVNTFGFFLPTNQPNWGPEMRLAELIANLHEKGTTAAPNVRLLKFCQDTSTVGPFPGQEEFSWEPNAIGGLFQLSMTELQAAVTSLGGWSQIARVHWLWVQGERESVFGLGYSDLISRTNALFTAIAGACGCPVVFSRLVSTDRYDTAFFPEIAKIREAQKSPAMLGTPFVYEDPTLINRMFFDNDSLDDLGRRMFERWLVGRDVSRLVQDYFYALPVDNDYVEKLSPGSITFSSVAEGLPNMHAPVLGAGLFSHAQDPTGGSVRFTFGSNDVLATVPASGSWTPISVAQEEIALLDARPSFVISVL